MKKIVFVIAVVFIALMTSAVYSSDSDDSQIPGLNVTDDIDAAFEDAQTHNRTLMIVFDQESCVYCEIFRDNVLSDSEVQSELNENFIVLLVDVNRNPEIALEYNVYGTPSVQFIDADGNDVGNIEGCPKKEDFLNEIREI